MLAPLSDTRRKILRAIVVSVEDRGFPPSVRELCAETGLSSTSTVKHHLDWLVAEGYISRWANRSRSIRVRKL
jgi:repressor LexA